MKNKYYIKDKILPKEANKENKEFIFKSYSQYYL